MQARRHHFGRLGLYGPFLALAVGIFLVLVVVVRPGG
jgi:hypothetical protein